MKVFESPLYWLAGIPVLLLAVLFGHEQPTQDERRVLVFTKTDGFRHSSIEPGKSALQKMGDERGFSVDFTEDANQFNTGNLKKYNAVIWLNTTGDVLNRTQQEEFERYIQAGGGYVGIHAAADCEYEWPWYGQLAGAYFLDHPVNNIQKGKFYVVQKDHWATKGMPDQFERTDEFYSFKNINPAINVLIKIDEKTYEGGKNGDDHPMSWYHEFSGGRSFYTAMGHTDSSFSESLFLNHVWAGINYAMGGDKPAKLDYTKARPEENRFSKIILEEKLDEPMELTVLNDERILFIERKGALRMYNTKTKKLKTIATIPVSTKYLDSDGKTTEGEDGLLGLSKDPGFAANHWIYLYYSDPNKSQNILTRYTLNGDALDINSRKVLLEVPTQREQCCHTGGSIAFDSKGNLYLSTGDNTNPHGSNGYSPSDERVGRAAWDAQKSSSNTNDLRGKIIRIKPNAEGTYSIPEGNLFAKNTDKARPEIYTMGHRNPFRISVDQNTGYLYWGEVGPDASDPDSSRGPAGHDEVGQARTAGNFGWPYFVGDNKPYHKFNFKDSISGTLWDASKPLNNSPNNTGLAELPPAQKAFIWYPYAESKDFPLVGSGGRNAMAGPVFYSDDFKTSKRSFPKYFDGKLLTYDWMRGWVMAVSLDKEGNYLSMEPFMPSHRFSNPMDMEFSPDGDLYMLEYGSGWFSANDDARLVKVEYNGGNRKPEVKIEANQMGGAVPFKLSLTSAGTKDADGDTIAYSWKIASKNGFTRTIKGGDAELTLSRPGVYKATLVADDMKGGVSTQSIEISAGNEPPKIIFDIGNNNRSFFFENKKVNYNVSVEDKEDGTLNNGKIKPESVVVNIDYLPEGYDKTQIAQGHRTADQSATVLKGKNLIGLGDCKACHSVDKKSIGPSYGDVAAKYKGNSNAQQLLAKKIISGGSGVWGEVPMPAHPQLSASDAAEMVNYILSLSNGSPKVKSLPAKGTFAAKLPTGDKGNGVYVFRAAYRDRGSNGLPGVSAEESFTLRSPKFSSHDFLEFKDVSKMTYSGNKFVIPSKPGSYIGLHEIDLTALSRVDVVAVAPKAQLNASGGFIEVRIGGPNGKLIGKSKFIEPTDSFNPDAVSIDLEPTKGSHNVYLVFANPQTKAGSGSMMLVISAEFKH
jgi:cytochrome c